MKKIWMIFLMCLCITPAFAQSSLVKAVERAVFSSKPLIQINRLMGNPTARLLSAAEKGSVTATLNIPGTNLIPARTLEPDELRKVLTPRFQTYVPSPFIQAENSVYRGMKLNELSELKKILEHGLKMNKSLYAGKIFASPTYEVAINYAIPRIWDRWGDQQLTDLPVMVRISSAGKNKPEPFAGQLVFRRDVPADQLADVMIFLEVNGTPGWYRATLNEGEVGLTEVASQYVPVSAGSMPSANSVRVLPSTSSLNAPGEKLRVFSEEKLRAAISNDEEMRLFVPETFVQHEQTLYRGLRLNNTEELYRILTSGMEVAKTKHGMIYVSPNVSIAMEYMFPSQAEWLLGVAEGDKLPVLVKIPLTERLEADNPPLKTQEEFGGRRILCKDIPAKMISEVAVYAEIEGVAGWYKVTLADGQLVFTPAPIKTMPGWIAK